MPTDMAMDDVRRPSRPAYAWYVVFLLALGHLVSFIDRFVMSLVLTPLKQDFALSDTQLGLLHGTGFVILYTVAAVPLGRLADVANRRNIIIAGLAFWSIATAACGLATSFGSLFAARIGVGLGEAALVPAAMSLIAAYVRRDQIGKAVSIFTTGATLGKSVALIVGGFILGWLTLRGGLRLPGVGVLPPWGGVFVIAAIPGLLLALLFLTVREPPRSGPAHRRPGLGEAFAHMRAHRSAYVLHIVAAACVVALVQGVAAWAPTFYTRMFGMTPAAAGVLVGSLFLFVGPGANLFAGWLLDRLQSRGVKWAPGLIMSVSLAAAIPCAIAFAFIRNFELSLVAYVAVSACMGAGSAPSLAGLQLMTPERLRGVASALFLAVVTFVAIGFGPTLIGYITDEVFGDPGSLNLSLLTIIAVLGAIGSVAAWFSRGPASRIAADR